MVPRKTPKVVQVEAPPSLSHSNSRAHAFSKGQGRLRFAIVDSPGPTFYNPPAMAASVAMTLSPFREAAEDPNKINSPGPGHYNIKAPITARLAEPRGRIGFGAVAIATSLEAEMNPGPGSYFPENFQSEKVYCA